MTKSQIGWVIAGVAVGILLTIVAIAQVRADIDSGEALPNPFSFLLCWPLILALVLPSSMPRSLSYGVMGVFNAGTFAIVFLIIGSSLQAVFSLARKIVLAKEQKSAGGSQ
jgi:hypothetical protein